jgi:hypothetical protein
MKPDQIRCSDGPRLQADIGGGSAILSEQSAHRH